MPIAIRNITRIQDADDITGPFGAGQDGYALTWDNATGKFVATGSVVITGGTVSGLTSLATNGNGLDVNPGSDADADLITVGVTGAPKIGWNEANDAFVFTHDVNLGNKSIYIDKSQSKKGRIWQDLVNSSPMMNVGYRYTDGATFEMYPDDHATRPGEMRYLFGSHSGASNFYIQHFDGGSTFSNHLRLFFNGTSLSGYFEVNNSNRDLDFIVKGAAGNRIIFADASTERVGVGVSGVSAKLHIDQSSATAAIPVLILDQADDSEEMIEFTAAIGTGNAIEAVGTKTLTTTHFIRINITGVGYRYIPVGTIA